MANFTPNQIAGYRAQLVGAINQCTNGSEVVLDLTSAKAIAAILKDTFHMERNLQTPEVLYAVLEEPL